MRYNITFQTFSSVDLLPVETWQKIVPSGNLLHLPQYLKLLENNLQKNMQCCYSFIKEDDTVVGVAYFQIVRFTGAQLKSYTRNSAKAVAYVQNAILNLIDVKLLVGANLFMSGEKGIYWIKDLPPQTKADYYEALVSHLLKSRNDLNGFLMTDVYAPDNCLARTFESQKFHSIYEEPDMMMQLNPSWNSFEDYLSALSSKYRVRAKRCIVLSKEIERRNLSEEDLEQYDKTLYQLYENTMNQASFSLAKLQPGYFASQKRITPEAYTVFGYFLNGELVGFNSLFCLNGRGEVHYVGLNYDINKETHLYQRMLYDMIECGIEKKLPELHFGRTASEIKSTIGAVPVNVNGYLKHKNSLLNSFVISPMAKAIKPKDFVFRNPFK